jgi:uncharacterized NAD-dependent epimerase/dehydratase family protein
MGFDLASGLHNLRRDEGDLVAAAQTHGGTLHDVRVPTVGDPVATGVKRRGKRCLAVGTDCSVGKMYTALPLARVSNPACQVAGIAVNTQAMDEARSRAYLEKAEAGMGLPATDPYRFGSGKLVDALAAI